MTSIDSDELVNALMKNDYFRELVAGAISDAVEDAFPGHTSIKEAITKGVENSFPFPSEISNDIYGATLEVMRERKK